MEFISLKDNERMYTIVKKAHSILRKGFHGIVPNRRLIKA